MEYIVDGVEIGQILLPKFLPLLTGDALAYALVAIGRSVQENQWQVLIVFVDVQSFRIFMDLPLILQH